MKVSVVMTTYNGEKYLIEQLDSLRNQTRGVDEIVIQDDCSTDNTVLVIKNYIKKWNLDKWTLCVNQTNKGWIRNFHECISKTTGDIVFFCDQDDVWYTEKIKIMVETMERNKNIDVLSSKLRLIDAQGNILPDRPKTIPYNSNNTQTVTPKQFTNKFIYDIVPGCTMAVRRNFIDVLNDVPDKNLIPHDRLYWRVGILLGVAYTLDQALINYRIHGNNASNPLLNSGNTFKSVEDRLKEAKSFNIGHNQIMTAYLSLRNRDKSIEAKLQKMSFFSVKREQYIKSNKILTPLYFFQNIKYYRSLRMFMGDLLTKGYKE